MDLSRFPAFHINNLLVRVSAIPPIMDRDIICNPKVVKKHGIDIPILQLETAMGSAVSCFSPERAIALLVPRHRYAPVKTSADLLILMVRIRRKVFLRLGSRKRRGVE